MGADFFITGWFERLPVPVGPDVRPGPDRSADERAVPERVTPTDPPRAAARPERRRGQAPHSAAPDARGRAEGAARGPASRLLTAWPGGFEAGPLPQAPAPFLAQRIAQEVLTDGPGSGPPPTAAVVYRAAAEAGMTILGPVVSLDIFV